MIKQITNIYSDHGVTALVVILFFVFIIYYFTNVSKRFKGVEVNVAVTNEVIKTIEKNTTEISKYIDKLTNMIENLSIIITDHDEDSKDAIKSANKKLDKQDEVSLRQHERVLDKIEGVNEKVGKIQSNAEQVLHIVTTKS